MNTRRNMMVRIHDSGDEDRDKLLEETILKWRALGPAAAWRAVFDMLGWWFSVRGMDPESQRIDRTHVEVRPVPWI